MANYDYDFEDDDPTAQDNPFGELIGKLLAAGEGKRAFIEIPNNAFKKTVAKLGAAANAVDRTAQKVSVEEGEKSTIYRFRLVPRVYRPRKPKEEAAAEKPSAKK